MDDTRATGGYNMGLCGIISKGSCTNEVKMKGGGQDVHGVQIERDITLGDKAGSHGKQYWRRAL